MKPSLFVPFAAAAVVACGGDDSSPPPSPPLTRGAVGGQAAASNPIDSRGLQAPSAACTDFDAYVNGKWRATTPFTLPGQAVISPSHTAERNAYDIQRQIASGGGTSARLKLLKAVYDAGMDRAAIERAGAAPVMPALARIDAIGNTDALVAYLMKPDDDDGSSVIGLGAEKRVPGLAPGQRLDLNMAIVSVRALGVMQRALYTDTTPESGAARDRYLRMNASLLRLAGVADAEQAAALAFDAEARLGRILPAAAEPADPVGKMSVVTLEEANRAVEHIEWRAYFRAQGITPPAKFVVADIAWIEALDRMIAEVPLTQWKATLKVWKLQDAAPYLSAAFREAGGPADGGMANGLVLDDPQWGDVQQAISTLPALAQSMSMEYAARAVTPQSIEVATRLVNDVRAAFRARLARAAWLSPETRARALEKERQMKVSVASQADAVDVSALLPQMTSVHFANLQAVHRFDLQRVRAAIGTTTDVLPFDAAQYMVNATYVHDENAILLHAAMLQPPMFDPNDDAAFNYGGLGAIIGHEISHGFDTQGAGRDGTGTMVDWWQADDRQRFMARASAMVKQFDAYEGAPGVFVDGRRTVNENIGDLGGLNAAYDALQARMASFPAENRPIDGLSQAQRFFISWAQRFRVKQTPAAVAESLAFGEHAPARFRIIGPLSNMTSFAAAFGCAPGQPMARGPDERVVIW